MSEKVDKEKKKGVKFVRVIVLSMILICALFAVLFLKDNNTLLFGIFVGAGSSLIAWISTDFFREKFDSSFEEHDEQTKRLLSSSELFENKWDGWVENSFCGHDEKTSKILDVVTQKFLSLKHMDRGEITSDQYEGYYQDATEIKISGIALKGFSNYLNNQGSPNNSRHLLNHLKTRKVNVKVLFIDPKAALIKCRTNDGNVQGDINTTIENFRTLFNAINKDKSNCSGNLEVKLIKCNIYSSLFHARQNNGSNIMLLGLLFAHARGDESPQYQVPNDKHSDLNLFTFCENNFNYLFGMATQLLYWSDDSIVWNDKY